MAHEPADQLDARLGEIEEDLASCDEHAKQALEKIATLETTIAQIQAEIAVLKTTLQRAPKAKVI